MTPRTEPMPYPVPEWLKDAVLREQGGAWTEWVDSISNRTIARLLWERGEPEPVDPDVEALWHVLTAWVGGQSVSKGTTGFHKALAAYKAEKART